MRTIRLKTTLAANPVVVSTYATTFGEFKKEPMVEALGIDWANNKLMDRQSKMSIELDDAVLPAGDLFLFCFPTATKSGADYGNLSFSELRKLCAEKLPKGVISANPTKIDMINALNNLNKESNPTTKEYGNGETIYSSISSEILKTEYEAIRRELASREYVGVVED